jgi:hypothetical protein
MLVPSSLPLPPRYVEYSNAVPPFNFATNASLKKTLALPP